jgi:hypothetical protein
MSTEPAEVTETTVVIADGAVVRKGLRLLIDAEPGLRVVAEAGTAQDPPLVPRRARPVRARTRARRALMIEESKPWT